MHGQPVKKPEEKLEVQHAGLEQNHNHRGPYTLVCGAQMYIPYYQMQAENGNHCKPPQHTREQLTDTEQSFRRIQLHERRPCQTLKRHPSMQPLQKETEQENTSPT
ncbi:hypothetical protein EYF80_025317 [Liparis tanakae]|uniref:Uncharacterized protein n=1 Tax=Liparis tanakae TaxID=230148 RepID=A0A4Z2HFH6_9TELE|nr:hypothetical protein EYF80_025317 [Liparis tanakae]